MMAVVKGIPRFPARVLILSMALPFLIPSPFLRGDEKELGSKFGGRNVLFLAVDDLNDWVGCLGGHPQADTPNIDRLAASGVLFENAHCAAPLCHPSRTAILTGLHPSTTGISGNEAWFREHPKLGNWVTLPQYFRQHGYLAFTGGKIFHQAHGEWSDPDSWDRQYSTKMATSFPPVKERYSHGMQSEFSNKILARLIDWSPIDVAKEETEDWMTAMGAAEILELEHERPFFLACGIYRPHLQWYAPKEFFDLHPLEQIQLPITLDNDIEDVPPLGRRMAAGAFDIIQKNGEWERAVQGYLASTSFADACIGHVLDALDASPHRDNTIVVLFGDHGYQIGEKGRFAKSSLWQQATRSPLIIRVPGNEANGSRCSRPVSLIDLYPALIALCGLPERNDLDGRNIAPLVRNPETEWPWPAVITHSPHWHGNNHAIRTERWHYIHYSDGGEELYDMARDPHQWKNLNEDPDHAAVKEELKQSLPNLNAPHFQGPPN